MIYYALKILFMNKSILFIEDCFFSKNILAEKHLWQLNNFIWLLKTIFYKNSSPFKRAI